MVSGLVRLVLEKKILVNCLSMITVKEERGDQKRGGEIAMLESGRQQREKS